MGGVDASRRSGCLGSPDGRWSYTRFDLGSGSAVDHLTTDGWFARGSGGADLFVVPNVAVKIQVACNHWDYDQEFVNFGGTTSTSEFKVDRLALSVGLGIFLRREDYRRSMSP